MAETDYHLLVSIPIEEVDMVLEALEQTVEDIYDAECDCDDCTRMLGTLETLIKQIHSVAPLQLPEKT